MSFGPTAGHFIVIVIVLALLKYFRYFCHLANHFVINEIRHIANSTTTTHTLPQSFAKEQAEMVSYGIFSIFSIMFCMDLNIFSLTDAIRIA